MSGRPHDPLGVVVVGTGFGARIHVPALRAAGFRVEALVGRNAERTERRARRLGVPRSLVSLEDALALPGVSAVTVATPPAEHAPVVLSAIAAGKHVLCEKPFALDAPEARRMLAAAEAAGVVHRVGFEFRWSPARALVARALARGAVGEPRFTTLVSYVPLLADPAVKMPPWWWDASRGGGWLAASGSHAIDQARTWLGEIDSVAAGLTHPTNPPDAADDGFTVLFRTRPGARGVLQQTGGAPGPMAGFTRIAGTAGTIWTEDDEVWLADGAGTRRLSIPEDLRLPVLPEPGADPPGRFTHLELGPYVRLCESFRDAICGIEPKKSVAPPDFGDGVASTEVIDAVRIAAREGRWVSVAASDAS